MNPGKKCSIPGCINLTQNKRYCATHDSVSSTLNIVCDNSCDLLLKNLNGLNDEILKHALTKVSPYLQCIAGALRHLIVGIVDDSRVNDPNNASVLAYNSTALTSTNNSLISHSLHRDIMDFSTSMKQMNGFSSDFSTKKSPAKTLTKDAIESENDMTPIVELTVINSKREDQVPQGYTLVAKSFCGKNADLNTGAGGRDVYLAYKRADTLPPQKSLQSLSSYTSQTATHSPMKSSIPESVSASYPLTALNVCYADVGEEPNFGFSLVKNAELQPANLNLGTNSSRIIFLATHRSGCPPDFAAYNSLFNPELCPDLSPRGLQSFIDQLESQNIMKDAETRYHPLSGPRGFGAPIVDIGVQFAGSKVAQKVDWHEIKYTSFGHQASLNSGNDNGLQSQLFFKVDVQPILDVVYRPLLDSIPESFTPTQFSCTRAYIRTCAIVTACLYSTNEHIVLRALQAFSRIGRDERALAQRIDKLDPTKKVLPAALNAFLQCVCDAVPLFLSCYSTSCLGKILLWLRSMVLLNASVLSIHTFLRVLDVCFQLRHEDKSHCVSHDILRVLTRKATDAVIAQSTVVALNLTSNSDVVSTTTKSPSSISNSLNGDTSSVSSASPIASLSSTTTNTWNSPITTTRRTSMEMGIFTSGTVRINNIAVESPASLSAISDDFPSMYIPEGDEKSLASPLPPPPPSMPSSPMSTASESFPLLSSPLSQSSQLTNSPLFNRASSTSSNALLTTVAPLTGSLSNMAVNFLSNPYDTCASIVRHIADIVIEAEQTNGDVGKFLGSQMGHELYSDITVISQMATSSFAPRNWVLSPPTGYKVNPVLLNNPLYTSDTEGQLGTQSDTPVLGSRPSAPEDPPAILGRSSGELPASSSSASQSSFLSLKNALSLRKSKNATTPANATHGSSHASMRSPRLSAGPNSNSFASPSPMMIPASGSGINSRGEIDSSAYKTWTRIFHPSPDLCSDGVTPYKWKFIKFSNPAHRTESKREQNSRRKMQRIALKKSAAEDRAAIDREYAIQKIINQRISDVYSHSYSELHLHVRQMLLAQQSQKGSLAQLASTQHHQSYEEMTLISCLLFLCKIATLPSTSDLSRLEFHKRKVHSLSLICAVLKAGTKFFSSSPTYIAILQRFLFPTMLSCVETLVHSVFRSVLDIFIVLWQNYYSSVTPELGIMVDSVLLRMLAAPKVPITFKRDILEMLDLLVSSPFALINLFYCFDCSFGAFTPTLRPPTLTSIQAGATKYGTTFGAITDAGNRIHLFERLITVLSAIAEGNMVLFQQQATPSNSLMLQALAPTDVALQSLRKLALRMLVQFMFNLSQWSGVPCVSRSSDVRAALRSTCLMYSDFIEPSPSEVPFSRGEWRQILMNMEKSYNPKHVGAQPPIQKTGILEEFIRVEIQNIVGNTPLGDYKSLLAESTVALDKENQNRVPSPETRTNSLMMSPHPSSTGSNMQYIYEQNCRASLERSEVRMQTVRTSQDRRSLTQAIKFLKNISPKLVSPDAVANLLFFTEGFDPADVGDLLANGDDDSCFTYRDYEHIRHYFVANLDFTGLTFIDALRYFTTHCCFKLPGEAQKVDRMLAIFCDAYCRDNPSVFSTADVAHTVCFMLMILNTDLHNPKLKEESNSAAYKHITFAQFCNSLKDCDNGKPLSHTFLMELYYGIAANGIVWINEDVAQTYVESCDPDVASHSNIPPFSSRAEPSVFVRRACAAIRSVSVCSVVSNLARDSSGMKFTTSTQFVKPMWDLVWYHTYRALSLRADSLTSNPCSVIQGSGPGAGNATLPFTVSDKALEAELDIDTLNMCIDGAAYGASISILLGLGRQRDYFTRILAKLRYLEQQREEFSLQRVSQNMSSPAALENKNQFSAQSIRNIADNEHLKQPWFQELRSLAESNTVAACKSVLAISCVTKDNISVQRKLQVLRKLQVDFGSGSEISILPLSSTLSFYIDADRSSAEFSKSFSQSTQISLPPSLNNPVLSVMPTSVIDVEHQHAESLGTERMLIPHRSLLKEGRLAKLSSSSKRQDYTFMLFSDLLLYATEGSQPLYRVHRVLHLSLVRINPMNSLTSTTQPQQNQSGVSNTNNNASSSGGNVSAGPVSEHCFKIVSPQKSFVVVAPNAATKTAWINAIVEAIHRLHQQRSRWNDMHFFARQFATELLTYETSPTNTSLNTGSANYGGGSGSVSVSGSQVEEMPRPSEVGWVSGNLTSFSPGLPVSNSIDIPNTIPMEDDHRISFAESQSRSLPPPFPGHSRAPSVQFGASANTASGLGLHAGGFHSPPPPLMGSMANSSSFSTNTPVPPLGSGPHPPSTPNYAMSPPMHPSSFNSPQPMSPLMRSNIVSPPPVPLHLRMRSIPNANKVTIAPEEVLAKCSAFVAHSSYYAHPSYAANNKTTSPANYCHLCVRPFAMFRRKAKCPCCSIIVCSDCITKKVSITLPVVGGSDKAKKETISKVCDACFGFVSGMIGPKMHPLIGPQEDHPSLN